MSPPAERTRLLGSARGIAAALAGVALLSAVLLVAFAAVRDSVHRAQTRTDNAQMLLVAQVDRETGLRGFVLTGLEAELAPYVSGTRLLAETFPRADREAAAMPGGQALLTRQRIVAARWQASAQRAILRTRRSAARPTLASMFARDQLMLQFREVNARYVRAAEAQESRDVASASRIGVVVVALIALALVFSAIFVIQSQRRRERQGKERQQVADRDRHDRERSYVEKGREFAQVLQFAESETEARQLIARHIESEIPGSTATVLDRDRRAPAGQDADTAPDDQSGCVALRFGQVHHEQAGDEQLVRCAVCGLGPGQASCTPIRVGARALGSLLVRHEQPLRDDDERLIAETVSYAGPLLANLRTLADARELALSDALSGLPNRRALDDAFVRHVAQARRSEMSLSVLMLDLDRFKLVNDRYGHDRGDEVLTRVSLVIREAARDSDFKARFGGEEFVVLLPDTDSAGAVVVAEKLREAIGSIVHPGLERSVTVSIGVATFPADGDTPSTLLHSADLALYEAKHAGRNRVRTAEQIDPSHQRT